VFCIVFCYHPLRPQSDPALLVEKLAADLNFIMKKHIAPVIIIVGDFNKLSTVIGGCLRTYQIVTEATHEINILDKVFASRPDMYAASVFCSLLKTKHRAVLVQPTMGLKLQKSSQRVKE